MKKLGKSAFPGFIGLKLRAVSIDGYCKRVAIRLEVYFKCTIRLPAVA